MEWFSQQFARRSVNKTPGIRMSLEERCGNRFIRVAFQSALHDRGFARSIGQQPDLVRGQQMLQTHTHAPCRQPRMAEISTRGFDRALVHLDPAAWAVRGRARLIQTEMPIEADTKKCKIKAAA